MRTASSTRRAGPWDTLSPLEGNLESARVDNGFIATDTIYSRHMFLSGYPLLHDARLGHSPAGRALRYLEAKFGYISFVPSRSVSALSPDLLREAQLLERSGIITAHHRVPAPPDEPQVFSVRIMYGGHARENAGGSSFFSEDDAFSRALSEALERYLWHETSDYFDAPLTASEEELLMKKVPHVALSYISGLPHRTGESSSIHERHKASLLWIRGQSLTDSKRTYLPAQLVSGPQVRSRSEPILRPHTTTGLATHFSRQTARLNGILEIVERDAFMISWLNRLAPDILPLEILTENNPRLMKSLSSCERYRLRPYVLRLLTDAPTHAIAIILEDITGGTPRFSAGLKAHYSLDAAVTGALLEALRARVNSRLDTEAPDARKDAHRARLRYWRNADHAKQLEWMLSGRTSPITEAPWSRDGENEHFARLIEWCRSKRYNCIAVPLGTSRKNVTKRFVEMMIIPQLHPLPIHEKDFSDDNPRLVEVPRHFGNPARDQTFNRIPHPFV